MGFKISKATEYAIIYLNNQGKSVQEIADELSISVNSVQPVVDENPSQAKVQTLKEKSFITETAAKRNNGVTILTPEGSAIGDEAKYIRNKE